MTELDRVIGIHLALTRERILLEWEAEDVRVFGVPGVQCELTGFASVIAEWAE